MSKKNIILPINFEDCKKINSSIDITNYDIYIGNKKDISDRNFLGNEINKSEFNSLKIKSEIYDYSKESDS